MAMSGASLLAQDATPAANPNQPARPVPERVRPERPLSGKVVSIDKDAKTITFGVLDAAGAVASNQVCVVATNTLIFKTGKRVELGDVATGETARFRTRKGDDGKLQASFIILGAPPVRQAPSATPPALVPATPPEKK